MSTPDQHAYSEANEEDNPFHVRELTTAQFTSLLGSQFANVATWGQRAITGSSLWSLEATGLETADAPSASFFAERTEQGWRVDHEPAPLYVVAVASNEPLPPIAASSALGDYGLEMVREPAEALERLHRELESQTAERTRLESELADANARLRRIEGSVTWQLFERARKVVFAVLGGEGSAAGRLLQSALRRIGSLFA
jgi:hypothetical protein